VSQTIEVRFKGTRKAYFAWEDAEAPLHLPVHEACFFPDPFGTCIAKPDCVVAIVSMPFRHFAALLSGSAFAFS